MLRCSKTFLSQKPNFYKYARKVYLQEFQYVRENRIAYFDIQIEGEFKGRVTFELFMKETPRTALNFFHFCKGDKVVNNKTLTYKNSKFHRVIPGFMCQGGIIDNKETNEVSIYGGTFPDENFLFSHEQPGMLSMANRGPNTNSSQFFITTSDCAW